MSFRVCVDTSLALKLVLAEAESQRGHELWQSWVEADVDIFCAGTSRLRINICDPQPRSPRPDER